MVKNHAEMKRRLQNKEKFIMLSSMHDGYEGQVRTPNVIGKSYIYSIVEDEPDCKVSRANGGKGVYMQFGKASDWHIENGICENISSNGQRLFAFKFVKDFDEEVEQSVSDEMSQMTFEQVAEFIEDKPVEEPKRKGRRVTVEFTLPNQYAISTEFHDAYIYIADSVQEAIAKYEEDRNCVVAHYDYYN